MTYSAPAAAWVPGGNGVQVFVRGTDNALWANTGSAGGFGGWRKVGGVLIDSPAAAGSPAPGVNVAVRGTDNAVWAGPTGPAAGPRSLRRGRPRLPRPRQAGCWAPTGR